jgi:hypothetical protein
MARTSPRAEVVLGKRSAVAAEVALSGVAVVPPGRAGQ